MSKRYTTKLFLLVFLCTAGRFGWALNIQLDHSVTLNSASSKLTGQVIHAYPDVRDCTEWYYIPAHLVASGGFDHRASPSQQKFDGIVQMVFLHLLELQARPEITFEDLERLRAEIVTKSAQKNYCDGRPLRADQISLNPAPVRLMEPAKRVDTTTPSYHAVVQTYGASDSAFFSSANSLALTYITDAADQQTSRTLRNLVSNSRKRPTLMGDLDYRLEGITAQMNVALKVNVVLNLAFKDAIDRQKCDVKNGSTDGNLAKLGFSVRSSVQHCYSELITQLEKGEAFGKGTFEMNGFDFGPPGHETTIVRPDERGELVPMPLEQYIKGELWEMWIQQKLGGLTEQMNAIAAKSPLLKAGNVTTVSDVRVEYKRSFYNEIVMRVPLIATELQGELEQQDLETPFAKCALANYRKQSSKYKTFLSYKAVPVEDSCFALQ